jgi:tetratricopeptide (TPR) repeat protein
LVLLAAVAWRTINWRHDRARFREAAGLCEQSEAAATDAHYRQALDLAQSAVEIAPELPLAYIRRARAKYLLGDDHGALTDCDQAIQRDPNLAIAYAYRAPLAWLRGPASNGVADAERALELDPDLPEGLNCLALAHWQAGNHPNAVEVASEAITINSNDPESYRARALARAAQDDVTAIQDFDASVLHSGEKPRYLVARAEYRVRRTATLVGQAAEEELRIASLDAMRAISLDAEYAPGHLAIARIQSARELRREMLITCNSAVFAYPRHVETFLHAAEDMSPSQKRRYQLLCDAMMTPLDGDELIKEGQWFGAIIGRIEKIISSRAKQRLPIEINRMSFPPETRATLWDYKVNVAMFFDAQWDLLRGVPVKVFLPMLCRKVGATFLVTPEKIEIVYIPNAEKIAATKRQHIAYEFLPAGDSSKREQSRLLFERVLDEKLTMNEAKRLLAGGDHAVGDVLGLLQFWMMNKTKAYLPIYVVYDSFPPELRQTFKDVLIRLKKREVGATIRELLDEALSQVLRAAKHEEPNARIVYQATSDYIAISYVDPDDDGRRDTDDWRPIPCSPQKCRPRPGAIQWLTRGLENVPESARLYLARGRIYLEQHEFDQAIDDFSRAIERNPSMVEAYRMRSMAYAVRGHEDDIERSRVDALATGEITK